jgi:hypothetical protein
MAMGIGAGVGQLNVAVESALGTPGAFHSLWLEEVPNFPSTQKYIPNTVKGFQDPRTVAKPQMIQMLSENAFSINTRIRRAAANGGTPDLVTLFKSAGWRADVSTGATTLTGTPTVSALIQAANKTAYGNFILIEQATGHYPVLVSALNTATITPHVRLSAAPSTGAAVNPMHTLTPTTATAYVVPTTQTLSFRTNTRGQYDDALGDLAFAMKGCALASVGEIVLGRVGSFPIIPMTFHGTMVSQTPADIAADTHTDSVQFAVITPLAEFSIQAASAAGDIVRVPGALVEMKINPGVAVVPVYNQAYSNIGGISHYILKQAPPEITVTAHFYKEAWTKALQTNLDGSNPSYCIQFLQPTTDLDTPAFAVCAPNCHMIAGGEPTFDNNADIVQITAKFVCNNAGIHSDTLISEVGTSPIYIGVSGEPA